MEYTVKELSIELSNKCMMRCIHCSSGSMPRALPGELEHDEIIRLIKEARGLGATVLSLSGGDPIVLDQSAVQEYVHSAKELGYDQVLYYTTGLRGYDNYGLVGLMDGDLRMWDAYRDVLTFIFSLHSHVATVNDYIMNVSGAWKMVVNNIKTTVRNRYATEIHMVPMLPNWDHVRGMLNLSEQLRVDKLSCLRFVPQTRGRAMRSRLNLRKYEFERMQEDFKALVSDLWKGEVALRLGCPIDFRHTVDKDMAEKAKPCHAGKDLILVRPQGDVHPCAAWKTLPNTDNIRNSSLAEIWQESVIFNELRAYHEGKYMEELSASTLDKSDWRCRSCRYAPSCMSGCPAQRLHWLSYYYGISVEINDIYRPLADPLCPLGG